MCKQTSALPSACQSYIVQSARVHEMVHECVRGLFESPLQGLNDAARDERQGDGRQGHVRRVEQQQLGQAVHGGQRLAQRDGGEERRGAIVGDSDRS